MNYIDDVCFKLSTLNDSNVSFSVCRLVVDEISFKFESVNPKAKIETGMAGITPDGTYKQKKIPYLLSDSHITEILDLVCDNR